MAILLPDGLEVTVECNGQALQEYDVANMHESHNGRHGRITKYISAASGSEFTIRVELTATVRSKFAKGMRWRINTDGLRLAHSFVQPSDLATTNSMMRKQVVVQDGADLVQRHFMFGTILPANGLKKKHVQPNASLGSIVVRFYRVESYSEAKKFRAYTWPKQGYHPKTESEVKGEAISLQLALGEKQAASPSIQYKTKDLDSEDNPYYEFTFLYRSIEDLRALDIVPRTPGPEFSEVERSLPVGDSRIGLLGDMSPEMLQNVLREIQKELEARASPSGTTQRLKTEPAARGNNSAPVLDSNDNDIEVIDARPAKRRRFEKVTGPVIELD